jgi:hypothetical protein
MGLQAFANFPRRSLLLTGAVMGVGVGGASLRAWAQSAALDGRRFEGVFLERGKTRGDSDTITFDAGRFRSSACDKYGYSDAPYKTSPQGEAVAFEAETASPRYGKLVWKGFVRGDKLDATAMMVREGKPPIENWIVAGAVK